MLKSIRESKTTKVIAVFTAFNLMLMIFNPTQAYALGGGPSQPEVQSFEPIGTTEMVDLFSGNFTYNIPLIDVGGYPINLSYHSGITTDQEASWTGLGWNVNPGVINRGMRGLPDDFKGDKIHKEFYMKPNETYGVNAGFGAEIYGLDKDALKALKAANKSSKDKRLNFNASLNLKYNNYVGVGMELGEGLSASMEGIKTPKTKSLGKATVSLNISIGTDGVGMSPGIGFSGKIYKQESDDIRAKSSISVGLSFNSRSGLAAINLNASASKKFKRKKVTRKDRNISLNGGANISFATTSYTPQLNMPMLNSSFNFRTTFGTELFGVHGEADISGYYSTQYLDDTIRNEKSYGYLYYQNAFTDTEKRSLWGIFKWEVPVNPILDINREKDGPFTEYTPALPLVNYTYDTYSVSGQGIGGTYRPHRGSVGIVSDREEWNHSSNISFPAVEIGVGNLAHNGTNFGMNTGDTRSGDWTNGNLLDSFFKFSSTTTNSDFETVYFKQAGEKTFDIETDNDNINSLFYKTGGFEPVDVKIDKFGTAYPMLQVQGSSSDIIGITDKYKRKNRAKRNEVISYLTAEDANVFGETKQIEYYNFNSFINNKPETIKLLHTDSNRVRDIRKSHHISQINVTRGDGARYIYGIPAYNKTQDEVTFAIAGQYIPDPQMEIPATETGLVSYTPGKDDKINNDNGKDEFYSKTTIPGFAHSYLLTHIYSADYVDSDNIPGPSKADIGTYTKFNYSMVPNYHWKVPYEDGVANYSEGLRSDTTDDKASYISGNKELWYLHSVETKTHIAFFITSDRKYDAKSTEDEHMKKLDEIRLYYKIDNKIDYSEEIPIKVVHFKYKNKNQSLCRGIDNGTAKLTLEKVWFTYGRSQRGELNKYVFNYGNNSEDNPSYGLKSNDRWGNYKPNDSDRPNAVYPYTSQEQGEADRSVQAWNLKEIRLPSGGKINIEYEADDYAYVQDRKAMQMFQVESVTSGSDTSKTNLYGFLKDRNKIIVKIPEHYKNYTIDDLLRDENGNVMKRLYFNFFIDLGGILNPEKYEHVSGWAEVKIWGSRINNDGTATIALKSIKINDRISLGKISPIVQTSLNFTRVNLPRIAYNLPNPEANGFVQIVQAIAATSTSVRQFIGGTSKVMMSGNKSNLFIPRKSFIRLYNPVGCKKGGGERVKSIRISDEWNTFSENETPSVYGQDYDYTDDNGKSSGVASYEPSVGGEENPFKQPLAYTDPLIPKKENIIDLPLGESFFPAPSVGYSKVTVTNFVSDTSSIGKTGYVEHRFYTAKDFPTKVDNTDLIDGKSLQRRRSIFNWFNLYAYDKMTASQGFLVELNDMHGKPKSVENFSEAGIRTSGTKYYYKTKDNQIDNTVKIINPDGSVQEKIIGVDYDFMVDMRESKTESTNVSFDSDLETFLVGVFPILVPILIPSYHHDLLRFRSVVTTKVINRYALLERTEAYQDGSVISTENIAYDAETGEVLLTKISNEYNKVDLKNVQPESFNDVYYTFKYPAHWYYDGMGQAYKNIAVEDEITVSGNMITGVDYLTYGDELMVYKENTSTPIEKKYWYNINSIIDKSGQKLPEGFYIVKVLRSGRKNIQNTAIGNVTCRKYPIIDNHIKFGTESEVVDANAVLLNDYVLLACNCQNINQGETINPFVKGKANNWRKDKDYVYLTQRTYSPIYRNNGYNTNIRDNGIYTSFNPFWQWIGDYLTPNTNNWIWSNEVTKYSSYGMELENKNPLNQYSSAVYGYGGTKVTSIAKNAQYREIGFDSFEDYGLDNCQEDHFSYEQYFLFIKDTTKITDKQSHTGKKSTILKQGETHRMLKQVKPCKD